MSVAVNLISWPVVELSVNYDKQFNIMLVTFNTFDNYASTVHAIREYAKPFGSNPLILHGYNNLRNKYVLDIIDEGKVSLLLMLVVNGTVVDIWI